MAFSSVFTDIPVIDIGPLISENYGTESYKQTANLIGDACKNVGKFFK